MPFITVDVRQTPLIDAQLSVSFTQLTELLRLVIDQSNAHEERLQHMQAHIDAVNKQNAELVAALADMRQAVQRHNTVGDWETVVKEQRAEIQNLKDQLHALQDPMQRELAALNKKLQQESQSTSVAFSSVQDKWVTLSQSMHDIQSKARVAAKFVEAWGVSAEELDAVMKDETDPVQKRTSYILSLPPMLRVTEKLNGGSSGGDSVVALRVQTELEAAIAAIVNEMTALQATVDSMRNRLQFGELDSKLREIDEKLRVLDATKADHLSLNIKTDKDVTSGLSQRLQDVRDELTALTDRLTNRSPTDAAAAKSHKAAVAPTAASNSTDDANLKKRVASLESEVLNLEQKKADRSELTKLYETIDAVTKTHQMHTLPNVDDSPGQPLRAKPPSVRLGSASRPNSDHSGAVDGVLPPVDAATVGLSRGSSAGQCRGGSASPRRGSTPVRPVFIGRSVVSVRDSSGGITPASLACVNR